MITFLKRIAAFLVFFTTGVTALLMISYTIEQKIGFNPPNENSIAVIGHSHPSTSVNDSIMSDLLSKKVKNYGVGGQSMFWTMVGARKLKHQGTQFFLIEITNSTYITDWKTIDAARSLREAHKVYFLEPSELTGLLKKDLVFTSRLLGRIPLPLKKVSGNFEKLEKSLVEETSSSTFVPDFDDQVIHEFIQKNDALFFVIFRAPQRLDYYDYMDPENEAYFINKFQAFGSYKNCVIMDFGHKYDNDSLFADYGHMNYKGATTFSTFLADTISRIPELKIN